MKWLWLLLLALPASAQTFPVNHLTAGSINGAYYPARCGDTNAPSWCSGTTPNAWFAAACAQLPSNGGVISLLGLTGTITAPMVCSSPTKQVITIADNTSTLNVSEADGLIPFPEDNGSMLLGSGAGQCLNTTVGGIHLLSGASVTAIVGPAHTNGTQENFTVGGVCLFGDPGATVSQGLIYSSKNFANTTIDGNMVSICETACVKILNNGQTKLTNNWLNVSDGSNTMTASPLIIQGTGAQGCNVGPIDVSGGQIEHALGGGPEVLVEGDGTGSPLACDIHLHDFGIERNPAGTASAVGIKFVDCKNCSAENIIASGVSAGSSAMVEIDQNTDISVQNVVLRNISDIFGSYTNILNDTTAAGVGAIPFLAQDFITTYYAYPGYVQPPVLPGNTLESLGADVMGGAGNFSTGSGTLPTGFTQTGCRTIDGLTCTYTRTNSTAPPGLTWSEEVQITASTDANGGDNGLQWSTPVSFTAGQTYIASFWAKGSMQGFPAALLWNPVTPITYCSNISPQTFQAAWTLYSFACTPTTSGSATIAVVSSTSPLGIGTFYLSDFTFAPVSPLTAGSLLTALSPYGIGPVSTAAASNCNQGGTLTSVAGCYVTSVSGVTRYVPFF